MLKTSIQTIFEILFDPMLEISKINYTVEYVETIVDIDFVYVVTIDESKNAKSQLEPKDKKCSKLIHKKCSKLIHKVEVRPRK